MKEKLFLFVIMMIWLLAGCNSEPDYTKDELPMAKTGEEGFVLGLYNDEEIEAARTFHIDSTAFEKNIVIGNKTSNAEEFALVMFDGGKQIEFEIDGSKYTNYMFEVESQKYENIPVLLELSEGYHPVNFIIFRSPNKKADDSSKISELDKLSRVMNIRTNIFFNTESMAGKDERNYDAEIIAEGRIHGAFISRPGDSNYNIWVNEKLDDRNQSLKYDLIYGNMENIELDCYIVTLHNWVQVPISDEVELIYDTIKPGEGRRISGGT